MVTFLKGKKASVTESSPESAVFGMLEVARCVEWVDPLWCLPWGVQTPQTSLTGKHLQQLNLKKWRPRSPRWRSLHDTRGDLTQLAGKDQGDWLSHTVSFIVVVVVLLQHQNHWGSRRCTPTSLLLHLKTWVGLNPGLIKRACVCVTELCRLSALCPNLQEWQPCSLYDSIDNRDNKPVVRTHTFSRSEEQPAVTKLLTAASPPGSDLLLFCLLCSHTASTTRSSSDTWGGPRPATGWQHDGRPHSPDIPDLYSSIPKTLLRAVDYVNTDYFGICVCVLLIYWHEKHFIIWKEVYDISEDKLI